MALAKRSMSTKKVAEKEAPLPGDRDAKSRGGQGASGSRGVASLSPGDWVASLEVALRGMWEVHEAEVQPMNILNPKSS